MKWQPIHPEPDTYNFEAANAYVEFGEEHDMFIVGHTLVWHSQVPDWIYEDTVGNKIGHEALIQRMKNPIAKVAGRYKGRVDAWDVVNEAASDGEGVRQSDGLKLSVKILSIKRLNTRTKWIRMLSFTITIIIFGNPKSGLELLSCSSGCRKIMCL